MTDIPYVSSRWYVSNWVYSIPRRRIFVSLKVPLFLETIGEYGIKTDVHEIAHDSG